jgi:TolA-binding protein
LFNEDAEYLTFRFVGENPESPLVNEAYFNLAGYFYARKRWRNSIEYYLKVNPDRLTMEEWSEYYFKKGYAYFSVDDYENAKTTFYHIKDVDTKYTPPAVYYYSHIHYEEKNYQTALNGFLRLTSDATFGPVVPYYIVHIYYLQGRYKEIIDFAPGIINKVTDKRLAEVARITAEAYAELGQYKESLPYYKTYLDSAKTVTKEDKYQVGYANYKAGEYDEAVSILGSISSTDNRLGQNAAYYLADCYLKLNDKQNARLAFQSASRSDYDPAIQQDALFNYALITYELSNDPFNEAIRAFQDFIDRYPESKRIQEAYRFLIQSYLNARNYRLAMESIEKSDIRSDEMKQAYQKIAFYRGIELYNNQQYADAIRHFDKSLKFGSFDQTLTSKAYYWKGESYFKLNDYQSAISAYTQFRNTPIAYTLDEFDLLDYDMGYAYFRQKNYAKAIESFRKFIDGAGNAMTNERADALNRIGDCFYAQSEYYPAADYYNRAGVISISGKDYALLQKGICEGLLNKDVQKIQTLQELVNAYPASTYSDDAIYEMAQSYLKIQNTDRALEKLKLLITKYPQSIYTPVSYVQIGLLYYNSDNNDQAIAYYKDAINRYPGTQVAKDALFGLKNIYVDMNKVDEYFAYANNLGQSVAEISVNEQDSLSYIAAEKIYMAGNCKEASKAFERYINTYPKGSFILNAHFYKGDCNYQLKEYDKALVSFTYIISQPKNMYTEQALLGAARIEIGQKQFQEAVKHYIQLAESNSSPGNIKEAWTGIMRGYYALKNYEKSLEWARKVSNLEKLTPELAREATYIAARSLQELGRNALALEEYKKISGEVMSAEGAEAKFRVAELSFQQGDDKTAEKEILEFSEKTTPHEYWIARSFILWADIFTQQKEYFQAIQTLQSIIDYYEKMDDGILDMARERKAKLVKLQEAKEQPSEHEDVEIKID